MQFLAGLLVGVAGVAGVITMIFAYLTWKAQLKQTDKRLHYVYYVSSLTLSRDDVTREAIKYYLNGEQLVNPKVYVIKIENAGNAPVVPSDFQSPIIMRFPASRFVELAFRENRPNILRREQIDLADSDRELRLGPALLNPHDTLRVIALVQGANDDLSITGRLAGVEQIVRIPPMDLNPAAELRLINKNWHDRTVGRINPKPRNMDVQSGDRALGTIKSEFPLFANPDGAVEMLLDGVEVRVHGESTNSPAIIRYSFTNENRQEVTLSDQDAPLSIQSGPSQFRHANASIRRQIGRRYDVREEVTMSLSPHELRIPPFRLGPGDMLNVDMIIDGSSDHLKVRSPVPVVEHLSLIPDPSTPLTVGLDYEKSLKYRISKLAVQLTRPSSRGY
jgi:hypothetical protein